VYICTPTPSKVAVGTGLHTVRRSYAVLLVIAVLLRYCLAVW
jgi:hypothetical protein